VQGTNVAHTVISGLPALATATLDDLRELGHPEDEARAILLDQQERACAPAN
jgi:hypothetical protein